jgi:hypothetical protein
VIDGVMERVAAARVTDDLLPLLGAIPLTLGERSSPRKTRTASSSKGSSSATSCGGAASKVILE